MVYRRDLFAEVSVHRGENTLEPTPSGAKGLLYFYPYILDFKTK